MISFIKKYKFFIIAAVIIIAVLTVAFISGGNVSETKRLAEERPYAETTVFVTQQNTEETSQPESTQETTVIDETALAETTEAIADQTSATQTFDVQQNTQPASKPVTQQTKPQIVKSESDNKTKVTKPAPAQKPTVQPATQDKYKTDPVPSDKPKPVEPIEQEVHNIKKSCTFSISCSTILDNLEMLDEDKIELVPEDGWILKPETVEFNEGENLFELTKRVCQEKNIHFSFVNNPVYNSAYVEDFGNLYEFDCGGNSGWMISVNDWFLNYGVSRYVLKDGDIVKWQYTCNLGYDIGGGYLQEEQND